MQILWVAAVSLIIVDVFLYQNNQSDDSHQLILAELNNTLFQLKQALGQLNGAGEIKDQNSLSPELRDAFFDSIRNATKPGVRLLNTE
jgi:hypothetical protein